MTEDEGVRRHTFADGSTDQLEDPGVPGYPAPRGGPLTILREPDAAGLDAAMARLEAALPDGWQPLVGREVGGWWATASVRDSTGLRVVSTSEHGVLHPDMGAALGALVEALAAQLDAQRAREAGGR